MATLDQRDEVSLILKQYPSGLTRHDLWDKCNTFESQLELSTCLHQMSNQLVILKTGDVYIDVGFVDTGKDVVAKVVDCLKPTKVDTEVAIEPKEKIPAVPVARNPVIKNIQETTSSPKIVTPSPKMKSNRMGSLRRKGATSIIALFMYLNKDRQYTRSELRELARLNDVLAPSFTTVLSRLVSDGYLSLNQTSPTTVHLQWSGEFDYPFSAKLSGDASLVSRVLPSKEPLNTESTDTTEPSLVVKPASFIARAEVDIDSGMLVAAVNKPNVSTSLLRSHLESRLASLKNDVAKLNLEMALYEQLIEILKDKEQQ